MIATSEDIGVMSLMLGACGEFTFDIGGHFDSSLLYALLLLLVQ